MRILLSNDDGIHAPGIKILYEELCKIGSVTVVAPLEEKSTTGHSLTIHKPLRIIPMGKNFFGVNGSPADCVYLGMRQILKKMPDLVVSGINRGANLGQDVYYSGTVSAAREACIYGVPALAVSLVVDYRHFKSEEEFHYRTAAKAAVRVLQKGLHKVLPQYSLLNLNVPDVPFKKLKGLQITRQGFRYYSGKILRRKDHRGRFYYWIGGEYQGYNKEEGSDCYMAASGFVSLTPMRLDLTDHASLVRFEKKLKQVKWDEK